MSKSLCFASLPEEDNRQLKIVNNSLLSLKEAKKKQEQGVRVRVRKGDIVLYISNILIPLQVTVSKFQ